MDVNYHQQSTCPEHFKMALEAYCPFYEGQANHLLKDYAIVRGYIHRMLG